MALIPIPEKWMNPRFEFGNSVYILFPRTEERVRGTVIGMRYITRNDYNLDEWIYDIVDENGHILDPATEDWLYLM